MVKPQASATVSTTVIANRPPASPVRQNVMGTIASAVAALVTKLEDLGAGRSVGGESVEGATEGRDVVGGVLAIRSRSYLISRGGKKTKAAIVSFDDGYSGAGRGTCTCERFPFGRLEEYCLLIFSRLIDVTGIFIVFETLLRKACGRGGPRGWGRRGRSVNHR